MSTKNGMGILEFRSLYEYKISLLFHEKKWFHILVGSFKTNNELIEGSTPAHQIWKISANSFYVLCANNPTDGRMDLLFDNLLFQCKGMMWNVIHVVFTRKNVHETI